MSHQKRNLVLRLGSLACATWMLAACTSGDDDVRTEDVRTPSTSVTTSAAPSTTTLSPTTESAPPMTTDPPSSASTSISAPLQWPATFTAEQIAAAQVGLATVTGLTQITERANAAPGLQDWTADVSQFAGGSAAQQTLASIKSLIDAKVHATSPQTYDSLTVLSADDSEMVIEACADSTQLTLVNESGQSVFTPPTNPRVIETFHLYVPVTGGWLVDEMSVSDPERPC